MITEPASDAMALLESIDGPLTIARLLTAERQGEGYTRAEMAKMLGVSVQRLCDIEHGRRRVSPSLAYLWGTRLGHSGKVWLRAAAEEELRTEMAKAGCAGRVTVKVA